MAQIHELRRAALQAVCRFEALNPGCDLRIADSGERQLVEAAESVEGCPLKVAVEPLRVREIQNGIAGAAEWTPAVDRW